MIEVSNKIILLKALECYSYEDQENDSFINDPRAAQIETCVSNRQCFYWREEISTSSSWLSLHFSDFLII